MKVLQKVEEKKYIPVPMEKWSTLMMMKFLDKMYSDTLKKILDNEANLTKEEMNARVDRALKVHKPIYEAIIDRGLTYKKNC